MLYKDVHELAKKVADNKKFINAIIGLREGYKSDDSKVFTDDKMKKEYTNVLKEIGIENQVVGISKRPFGVNIEVGGCIISVYIKVTGNNGQMFVKLKK